MFRHRTHATRVLATSICLWLAAFTSTPGIAAACEGGGGELPANFSITANPTTVMGVNSTSTITIKNISGKAATVNSVKAADPGGEFTFPMPTGCSKNYPMANETCPFKATYAGVANDTITFTVEDENGTKAKASVSGKP